MWFTHSDWPAFAAIKKEGSEGFFVCLFGMGNECMYLNQILASLGLSTKDFPILSSISSHLTKTIIASLDGCRIDRCFLDFYSHPHSKFKVFI